MLLVAEPLALGWGVSMANTKPIGVAYADQNIEGADLVEATKVYASSQLGYTTDSYRTVTQTGNWA